MYGKLINGILMPAPPTITEYGKTHYHPSEALYKKHGYLPVDETPYPDNDDENPKYYISSYVEQDEKIVKVWSEAAPPEQSPQDRINELKQRLADTDYIACKIAEGVATKEEYSEELAQRQAWRNAINELENGGAKM